MLSQNVAKSTAPSYYMIRTNLPHRKPMNQWQPVYYFSGITKRLQRKLLLGHKRLQEQATATLQATTAAALAQHDALLRSGTTSIDQPIDAIRVASELYSHGMVQLGSALVNDLHRTRSLTAFEYATLIRSLAADRVAQHVLHTSAQHDPALTYKLMGERQGAERCAEAHRIFDMAHTTLNALGKRGVGAAHYNALMEVLLTCGYGDAQRVHSTWYDDMGSRAVAPTARTYELVIRSLVLTGTMAEADSVLSFMRSHHGDELSIHMLNSMLLGHRENKTYDQCDAVWNEAFDRRWPRPTVETAELYLRSIIDHSYTQVGSESMSLSGRLNVLEKKKVPIILTQLDTLGIPRISLSPPLLDEIEDALRKFAIHKSRFYEWGRAVKQFNFIEFRRRQGWMYDLHEMYIPTRQVASQRDPARPDAAVGIFLGAELPGHFSEKQPWMLDALQSELYTSSDKERMEDVRAGDIYYDDTKSIHQRSATWASEVPQSRYDQLYGMNHPDIPKIGIRRHLDSEYVNRKEILEKDAAIVMKAQSKARRLRRKTEVASTHRNAAEDIPK